MSQYSCMRAKTSENLCCIAFRVIQCSNGDGGCVVIYSACKGLPIKWCTLFLGTSYFNSAVTGRMVGIEKQFAAGNNRGLGS